MIEDLSCPSALTETLRDITECPSHVSLAVLTLRIEHLSFPEAFIVAPHHVTLAFSSALEELVLHLSQGGRIIGDAVIILVCVAADAELATDQATARELDGSQTARCLSGIACRLC